MAARITLPAARRRIHRGGDPARNEAREQDAPRTAAPRRSGRGRTRRATLQPNDCGLMTPSSSHAKPAPVAQAAPVPTNPVSRSSP